MRHIGSRKMRVSILTAALALYAGSGLAENDALKCGRGELSWCEGLTVNALDGGAKIVGTVADDGSWVNHVVYVGANGYTLEGIYATAEMMLHGGFASLVQHRFCNFPSDHSAVLSAASLPLNRENLDHGTTS